MNIILPRHCSLRLSRGTEIIWEKKSYNCEYLAGVLAASLPIILDLSENEEQDYKWDGNFDLSTFLLWNSIVEENISYYRNNFGKKKYHLWLRTNLSFRYSLYNFHHADFLRGILDICHFFNVDFRTYCYGGIYDRQGYYYYLLDYNAFQKSESHVSLISHDMEHEQYDNENVIELLHKDY